MAELENRFVRLNRALEFATVDIEDVYPEPSRTSCLVGALAVRSGDRVIPVPGSLALDGLSGSLTRLLTKLAEGAGPRDSAERVKLAGRLADVSWHPVRSSFENLVAHCVPVTFDSGGATYWMICPSARHVVVLALATGVRAGDVDKAVERARRDLNRVKSGATVRAVGTAPVGVPVPDAADLPIDPSVLMGGSGEVAADVEITRVVLIDGPQRAEPIQRWHRGPARMTVDDWCRLTAQADDPEVLWAFLDELTQLPGLDHVTAFELGDLWAVFRKYGALNPGATKFADWQVPARESGREWQRGAELDSVEEMLYRWDMGGTRAWPSCTIDDDGQVELHSLTLFAQAVVNPRLGFGVAVCDRERRTDHYFASLLVQAIQFGLGEMGQEPAEEGWVAWRTAVNGEPLLIELVGAQLDAEQFPICLFAVIPGERVVLTYDEDRLRNLPSAELHDWLGRALSDAVLALTAQQTIDWEDESILSSRDVARDDPRAASAREVFRTAWLATPPPLKKIYFSGPSARPATVFIAARTTTQAHIRAGRRIAEELVRRGVAPQHVSGRDAIPLLGEICDATDAALARMLGAYRPDAVRGAAEEVERVWEMRFQSEQLRTVRTDLTPEQAASLEVAESETSRAADHVLELLIRQNPAGRLRLDHRDWTQLVNLAAECLRLRDHLAAARCGLLSLDLEVVEGGLVRSVFMNMLLDIPRHQAERVELHANSVAAMVEEQPLGPDPADGDENPFASVREHLSQLAANSRDQQKRRQAKLMLAVDDAMRQTMGTDLDALLAVLMTVSAWDVPGDPYALTAEVPAEKLIGSVAVWSGLSQDLIRGALRWLTVTGALLEGEELPYWAMEGRDARLTVRPIVQLPGSHGLLLLPRRATASRRVMSNYFFSARLPWPAAVLPDSVNAALRAWSQHENQRFEVEVEEEFCRSGVTARKRALLPHKAAKVGLTITRELDLLAADPGRSTIWVVEAKNQHVPYGPNQMVHEYVDYHGVSGELAESIGARQAQPPDKAFVGKLLDNAAQLAGQKAAVLQLLGVEADDPEAWQIIPLIVTSRPSPAAVAAEPRVAFTTLSGLRHFLRP